MKLFLLLCRWPARCLFLWAVWLPGHMEVFPENLDGQITDIMKPVKSSWNSPSLGEKVKLEIYGNGGTPVIHFDGYPGYFTNSERTGVLAGIKFQIVNDLNRIYCPDFSDHTKMLENNIEPEARIISHMHFEGFVCDELVMKIKKESNHQFIILSGVGMGAFYAINLMLKHPEKFDKLIAVCGPSDLRPFFGDYHSEDLYYNNPHEFLPNLNDPIILDCIRSNDLRLVSIHGDPYMQQMISLSELLGNKSIDHVLDVWGADRENTPETWAEMIRKHIP